MGDRRQEILEAALAIADERGLAAVTMRAVAERVGVTSMALYPHIGDKDGLLDGMLGQLLSKLPLPATGADWQTRLTALGRAARSLSKQHPGAMTLVFARPSVTPDAVRVVDAIYELLLEAGVPAADVPRIERLVSTTILGYAVSEVSGRFGAGTLNPRGRRGQLAEGELPGHHALAEWLDKEVDWDAEFEADMADLSRIITSYADADR